MIAEVIVNHKSKSVDKAFDYTIPEELAGKIGVGSCVIVPFGAGNKPNEAYVIAVKDTSKTKKLKSITRLSKDIRVFDDKQLELICWMREKYLITYLDAIHAVAPAGTGVNQEEYIILADKESASKNQAEIIRVLEENGGEMEVNRLMNYFENNIRIQLNAMNKNGAVKTEYRDNRGVKDRVISVAKVSVQQSDIPHIILQLERSKALVQAKMLDILSSCEYLSLSDLVHFSEGNYNALRSLEKKGYIETFEITVLRELPEENIKKDAPKELTDEQKKVLRPLQETVGKTEFKPYLLHGVTGSGKTEVYMNVIEKTVAKGRQAIVLVPEISLTPQMVSRFKGRFGSNVAIIHSGLSLGEKYDQWKKIKSGAANIVVGARSAIFAPLSDIGAIIIDEEHEQTYKSEMTPRYQTHEVAEFRARQYGALLLLASATPKIESYYKAKTGEITLLEMSHRFNNNPMPKVIVTDLRDELEKGNKSVLGEALKTAIKQNLKRKKQTILFLNRRGFSTFVSCRKCGFVAECPNCSISLTYHKFDDSLRCHYCGHTIKNYTACPSCGSKYIRYFGGGTQKVEEEIHNLFPDAATIRMDIDTTGRKHSHEQILKRFEQEKIDILIGTQMVTKGLDFPDVTLVGVISADTILNIDDYRAQERTFSLLEQVTGRAGRAKDEGLSIIQTYSPDNKAITFMQQHDYKGFFNEEIKVRKAMWYPPFCEIVGVIFSGNNENITANCSKFFAKQLAGLRDQRQRVQILGPIPAYVSKIKNKYIYRMIIKCENSDRLNNILVSAKMECMKNKSYENVAVVIDKNPNNMG
ncbi:MAG: primosomal protein N' [Clostridiales bacterium]|nr:primosomal protein N' [Clostridiales bacterium]